MVIGNGMLAKLFSIYNDNDNVVIFASGVSNSKEVKHLEFDRELELLKKSISNNPDKIFIYFSTSSMYDPVSCDSPYVKHKLHMEEYIINHVRSYYIFRVSQIIGRANNNTLINFIINNILEENTFKVWKNATRNLIAIYDVKMIVCYIIDNSLMMNQIINVANKYNISMLDLVDIAESVLSKKSRYQLVELGSPFMSINVNAISHVCDILNINFDDKQYYHNAIRAIL